MIPTSNENFSCNKIAIDFTLPDGSVEQIETRVREREQAQWIYDDKVASGQTAVIATLPKANGRFSEKAFMRLCLGNMPARSKAVLRAYCSWKLDVEDQSYCLRIPMTYVPGYLGNESNLPSINRL